MLLFINTNFYDFKLFFKYTWSFKKFVGTIPNMGGGPPTSGTDRRQSHIETTSFNYPRESRSTPKMIK